jgi:DNA recombination protein RmuC
MPLVVVISTAVVLIAFGAFLFFLATGFEKRWREEGTRLREDTREMMKLVQEELHHQRDLVAETQSSIGERLEGTGALVAEVQNQLGQLEQANRRILDLGESLGREVNGLQHILQAPKLRGGLGELFLGDLLEQVLGAEYYELQFPFKNGERVDAVVKLAQGIVPIDAKFPLENFRRFAASQNESEAKGYRKEFYRDVKRHIGEIAQKYLAPDEGTLDFALMYIPAENIYYETVIREDNAGESTAIYEYAQAKRVIPVSPNTLYVYLASIAHGLQGLKIEAHAKEILANIQRMSGDLGKFDQEFHKLGSHLKNASASYDKSARDFSHFHERFTRYDALEARGCEEVAQS